MKKIKEISFDLDLKGRGIVNRDGEEVKMLVKNTDEYFGSLYLQGKKLKNKNFSFSKRVFEKNGKSREFVNNKKEIVTYDVLTSKLKISNNCLREMIYNDDPQYPSSLIVRDMSLLNKYNASVCGLTRGYLYPSLNLKKTSTLLITDAIQTSNSVPTLETCVNGRELESVEDNKTKKKDDIDIIDESLITLDESSSILDDDTINTSKMKKSSNSLYVKENVGDIEYSAKGFINLKMLEIISLDDFYNRKAGLSDYAIEGNLFDVALKETFGGEYGEIGYYNWYNNPTGLTYGELGILLNNEARLYLIKETFKRILKIKKYNNGGYVEIDNLKINLIFDDNTEKTEIIKPNDINKIDSIFNNLETFEYYVKVKDFDGESNKPNEKVVKKNKKS